MPVVEIVGVYPVQTREPCHLVELLVRSCEGPFDLTLVTQRDRDQPRANWQVPFAEKMLDPSGERVEWDLSDRPGDEALWRGDVRLVFFFHYLDTELPLVTPFGDIRVPTPTERPAEYAAGHIRGARPAPIDDLDQVLESLPRRGEVVAYCRGPYCIFADQAVRLLRRHGRRARRLDVGLPEWRRAGHPLEPEMSEEIPA